MAVASTAANHVRVLAPPPRAPKRGPFFASLPVSASPKSFKTLKALRRSEALGRTNALSPKRAQRFGRSSTSRSVTVRCEASGQRVIVDFSCFYFFLPHLFVMIKLINVNYWWRKFLTWMILDWWTLVSYFVGMKRFKSIAESSAIARESFSTRLYQFMTKYCMSSIMLYAKPRSCKYMDFIVCHQTSMQLCKLCHTNMWICCSLN